MVLLGVTDTVRAITYGPVESKGNLVYKFNPNPAANIPILMQNLENPVPKVTNNDTMAPLKNSISSLESSSSTLKD